MEESSGSAGFATSGAETGRILRLLMGFTLAICLAVVGPGSAGRETASLFRATTSRERHGTPKIPECPLDGPLSTPIRAGNNGPENAGCKFFPVLRLVAGLPRSLPSRLKNTSPASKTPVPTILKRPELVSSEGSLPRSHCASLNLCSLQLLLAVTCRATTARKCNPQTLAATLTGSPAQAVKTGGGQADDR